jgi:hypothetical protein
MEPERKAQLDQGAYSLGVVAALYDENTRLMEQNERYRIGLERIASITYGGQKHVENIIAEQVLARG